MVPDRSYIVGASARTGSTLLCRALADTGVAGRPEEYFLTGPPEAFPPGWRFWEEGIIASHFGPMDREEYLDLVHRIGTSDNGVFGAKVMFNYVDWMVEKLTELPRHRGLDRVSALRVLFPNLTHVVVLHRRDLVRQAVSWARASQDGVWVVSDTEPAVPTGEPTYDPRFLAGLVGLAAESRTQWRGLCGELGISPHEVAYEDLVDPVRYERVVAGVVAYLGVARTRIPPPRTTRQADDLNDAWAERFGAELVEGYWTHHRRSISARRADRLAARDERWATDAIDAIVDAGGPAAVTLLCDLASAAAGDAELAFLGAGPVEDLVRRHGADAAAAVDAAAGRHPTFRRALEFSIP